jgi:beta-glucosidase
VVRPDAELAITLNPYPVRTAGDRPEDEDAARRVDGVANRLWSHPVLHGRYPEDVLDDFAAVSDLAHVRDGDLDQIARPLDAVGVNYYRRHHVRWGDRASSSGAAAVWPGSPDVELVEAPGRAVTDGGWAVEPDGLTEALLALAAEAPGLRLYVHESGAAYEDEPQPDGVVDDGRRIEYLDAHLRAAREAAEAGVDLGGFFVWSLLDNFEWAEGYTHRFGLVHVDFATGRRRPKASARWYGELAAGLS